MSAGNFRQLISNLRVGRQVRLELSRLQRKPGRLLVIGPAGDLLEDRCDALVVPCNLRATTKGGIVQLVEQRYPRAVQSYKAIAPRLSLGEIWVTEPEKLSAGAHARWVIFVATMASHRDRAEIATIRAGLAELTRWAEIEKPGAIAIPALGCGLGGLTWEEVLPELEAAAKRMPLVETHLYEPHAAPTRGRR